MKSSNTEFEYFDIEPVLSRNALMTFVISSRGAGKTYSSKKRIIRRFEKHGDKFLFLKRTETELDATADGFWDDFATKKQAFKHVKNRFYIGVRTVTKNEDGDDIEEIIWKLFGYSAALSTTAKLKGISPQGVKTILWDEFIAYDGRYLRDEAQRLMDVIETVDRMKDEVRVIGTGNKNEDGFYPVFHELGLAKSSNFEDNKIYSFKNNTVVIYSFTNEAYIKAKSQTRLGKLAAGTNYYEKMILNTNESSYSELVGDKPRRSTPLFTIVIMAEFYLVSFIMIGKNRGIYIEQTQKQKAERKTYGTDNSIPTYPRLAGNGIQMLYGYMTSGCVRFDSQVTAQKAIQAIITKKR